MSNDPILTRHCCLHAVPAREKRELDLTQQRLRPLRGAYDHTETPSPRHKRVLQTVKGPHWDIPDA